ncbi:MAG TPA: hypothetical protein VK807_23015 [Gemmatimonadaceae bacterium]|jgi:hypothetical protein|nr:hypothetical protein [Gemmatimonadaceae bacterium]
MRGAVVGCVVAVVLLAACGSSTAPRNRSVTGAWQGTFAPEVDCQVFTFGLQQSGQSVGGSWRQSQCASGGGVGNPLASGTNLSGTDVSDSVNIVFGVTGVFIARLDASGDTLNGDLNNVSFFMTRQ